MLPPIFCRENAASDFQQTEVTAFFLQQTEVAAPVLQQTEVASFVLLQTEVAAPQRSGTKVTFPLVWTNTCCSHPLYRETELIEENALGVRNAAQRKLFDELGIPAEDAPVDQFLALGRILYKAPSDGKWGEHELDYLLFIVRDVNVNPNPDEVADIKYVNRDELKDLLRKADAGEEGLKLSPWFRLVVDNFLFKWWDQVEKGTLLEAADMKTIHKLT
ncbi:rRNA processing protein [Sarracenia purpurea var. burkii]